MCLLRARGNWSSRGPWYCCLMRVCVVQAVAVVGCTRHVTLQLKILTWPALVRLLLSAVCSVRLKLFSFLVPTSPSVCEVLQG